MEVIKASFVPDITQNPKLLEKFSESGPYYTNYPTHGNWSNQLHHAAYVESLKDFFSKNSDAPIHLYIHIPFCAKLCYYCICNIKITNSREKMQHFTDYLCREVDLLKNIFPIFQSSLISKKYTWAEERPRIWKTTKFSR